MVGKKATLALVTVVLTTVAIVVFAYFAYLGRPQAILRFADFKFTNQVSSSGSEYVRVEGTIYNAGDSSAREVELILRLYDSENHLLTTKTLDMGDIPAKDYKTVFTDIPCSHLAYGCGYEVKWKP